MGSSVLGAFLDPYLSDWLDAVIRFLHVIAAIAWIGSSFYFVLLDSKLHPPKRREDASAGVGGELWEVHGGGFYHVQKYRLAPARLPDQLEWFKWEAYTTWLSGFALLTVLYYLDADTYLVDPAVADLGDWEAVGLSLAGLALAWLAYDALLNLVRSELVVAVAIAGLTALAAWGASELFAPRAAWLQVGAMLGTIMAANVFRSITPAHRELVAAKEAGREPDPAPGIDAKRRSVHNNYLTLPVLLTMLAGHATFLYARENAWLVLLALMAIAAWVRLFFNLRHAGRTAWSIPAVGAVALLALAIGLEPDDEEAPAGGTAVAFAQVQAIVEERCLTCHTGAGAPAGIALDDPETVATRAEDIRGVVEARVMPPGNQTGMTDAERETVVRWVRQGAPTG
jgi:uncharacterized membrane protein